VAGGAAGLVRGNNRFALEHFQQLASAGGNVFLSPFSISTALAMTYAGANGATAQGMAAALRFPAAGPSFDAAFRELLPAARRAGPPSEVSHRIVVQPEPAAPGARHETRLLARR
jgi:serpin B